MTPPKTTAIPQRGNRRPFACGDFELNLGKRTHLMGVLNVTPDSFFDGGRFLRLEDALKKAEQMVSEGADILDIGGESSRPGAIPVNVEEEKKRVLPVIRSLRKHFPIPISIDTVKAEIAEAALGEGAAIINDIGGLQRDTRIAGIAARYGAGVVIMHMKGRPGYMQDAPEYENVSREVRDYLQRGIEAGRRAGIPEDHVLIDPGIGFGKTFSHNLEIVRNLPDFLDLKKPILVGLSRKSFLGRVSGLPPEERLEGSLAGAVIAILQGVSVLRIHDVKETKRAVQVADLFRDKLP